MQSKRYAIIVAGGAGIRMGFDIPKQFIELAGKPILMRTIEVFDGLLNRPEIIIVLPETQIEYWHQLCHKHSFDVKHRLAKGGAERFYSVLNGLSLVDTDNATVAIHDGVRPFVNQSVIEECFETAYEKGSAIPVIQPVESVRLVESSGTVAFPRSKVMLVQTPQVFQYRLIKEAYAQPYNPNFTDDASVVEAMGSRVFTVTGNVENIKITTQTDLVFASALLKSR